MATSTNKYKLTKPELSEKVQVEVLNANMDLIDSALIDLQNQATANKNKADSTAQNLQNHISDKNNPHGMTKGQLGLGNVENKSSATIRGELTKNNVTNALGYTPYTPSEVDNKLSALETKIDWKEAVNTFNDIATTYPTPQDGWTVNVKDTDYTYRYDGNNWVVISANAIPKATQSVDGLLSKEDKSNYDDANSKKHTHNNKSILDKITQSLLDNWNTAYTHISDTIKHISSTERTNWTDAYNKRHTHNNKSVLDEITSSLISAWNNATDHISDTVKHIRTVEKEKLRNIEDGAEVNVQSDWNATDTGADAYIKNKPTSMKNPATLTFTGGVTGTYDGSSAKTVTIPTSLPASNTTSDYSTTGTAPVNGVAVNKALQTLDVASKGGSGKYIQSISETDGKISAVEATMPTSLPANGGTAQTISETLPISKGGTGKTTAADGFKALIDGVGTGEATPEDNDWWLTQYAGGSGTTKNETPVKRKMIALWNYVKSKLATVAISGKYSDLSGQPIIPTSLPANGGTSNYTKYVNVNNIPANANLNNYTTSGFYYCPANATVATFTNSPTTNAFFMIVGKHAGTYQEIIEYMTASPKRYMRNHYNNTWGNWYRVYTTADAPPDTKYSLPLMTASVRGGAKIGYTANGNNYPVQLNNEQMYVNVPWNNTTYTAGSQISLSGTTFKLSDFCKTITDWNAATTNGWYMASNASNKPADGWMYGIVIAHNANYVRQIVYHFATDANVSGINCDRYERVKHNGTWGSWVNTSVHKAVPSNAVFTDTIADISGKINKSGDTMTGALNFKNNTWNNVGDDVAIGDHNVAGGLGIKGLNGNTRIDFVAKDGSSSKSIVYDGTNLTMDGNAKSAFSGITDSITSTSSNVAASAMAVKTLNDKITQTNSNIRIPLTIASGASAGELDILGKSVTFVFNTNIDGVVANHKYTNIFTIPASYAPCTAVFGVGVIVDANFSVKGEFCIVVNSDGSAILNSTISHSNALSYICSIDWKSA